MTTDIGWDDGWTGERKLWQWTRDVKVVGASAVEKAGDRDWRIKSAPGAHLTVTYRIISAYDHDPTVDDSDQPRPVVRPDCFYAVGNALFAYPAVLPAVALHEAVDAQSRRSAIGSCSG
jgi:predicted metalloprotease with PDZ domain